MIELRRQVVRLLAWGYEWHIRDGRERWTRRELQAAQDVATLWAWMLSP